YRYSPEEIATLRSMAEEYNYPKEDLILESNMLLPTIDEYEKIMLIAHGIKESFKDLEIIDCNINSIYMNNINKSVIKRSLSSSMEYSGKHSETYRENIGSTQSFAYLILNVTWKNVSPTDNTIGEVDVDLRMDLSAELYDDGFEIDEFYCNWEFAGSKTLIITYKYKVVNRYFPQTVEIKQGYPNWLEVNLE
ncbi:MAG: hypothetical protein IKA86_06245, partial [Paraprevotella sp.]|nr:hypothetical protein [Paraprevotella sp.]